jgi:DNA mismatch repair protein MutL
MQPEQPGARVYQMDRPSMGARTAAFNGQAPEPGFAETAGMWGRVEVPSEEVVQTADEAPEYPLGTARGQVHENYIIAQTATGMVIVDQHAAHERLVYEKLKHQMAENGVAAQALLIPEIIELSANDCARLLELAEPLGKLGLGIEAFGGSAIAVRETPAILGTVNARDMLLDILDELADQNDSNLLQAKIEAILSRIACHGSIRSGRWMRGEEMNALLGGLECRCFVHGYRRKRRKLIIVKPRFTSIKMVRPD